MGNESTVDIKDLPSQKRRHWGGWIASEINAINILLNKPGTYTTAWSYSLVSIESLGDLKL